MQVGVISEDNFPQILRGISQRRRHGVLEIHAGERIIEISFYQGKIFSVALDRRDLLCRVADLLVLRGKMLEGDWNVPGLKFSALLEQAEAEGYFEAREALPIIVRQVALEALYQIELEGGSYYNFRVEHVEKDDDNPIEISVGQLLLDIAAYRENHLTFNKRLGEDDILCRGTPAEREYSFEENELIWLVDGEMTVAQLRSCTFLNRLTFEESLLSLLHERILSDVRTDEGADSAFSLGNIDASLDACIENAFDPMPCINSPAELVESVLAERSASKRGKAATPKATNCIGSTVTELSNRLVASPYTAEVTVGIFVISAIVIPLFLW